MVTIRSREWSVLIIYIITAVLFLVSLCADRRKTAASLKVAFRRFTRIAPSFLVMLILVAVVLSLIPDQLLVRVMARESKWSATLAAAGLGSVSIMPGFIAFPLCGLLLERGALFMVLAAFSTTVMMVGVATFPLELTYLGTPLALIRNMVSLVVAIIVAIAIGFCFGELP